MGFVQSAHNTGTSNSLTVTLGSTPTAGNCLIGAAGVEASSSNTVTSFKTNSLADNWASSIARNTTGTDGVGAAIWSNQNLSVTSETVNVAYGATGGNGAYVVEWAGIKSSSALDKTSSAGISSSTSFSSGTTATLSQATEVAMGFTFASLESTTTTYTPPGAYTNLTALAPASEVSGIGGYQQVNATTGLSYAGSSSATQFVGQGLIATYELAPAVVTASGGITLNPMPLAGETSEIFTATGGLRLNPIPLAGTTTENFAASGGITLNPIPLSGQQAGNVTASGGITLNPVMLAGSAAVGTDVTASGGITLNPISLAGRQVIPRINFSSGFTPFATVPGWQPGHFTSFTGDIE